MIEIFDLLRREKKVPLDELKINNFTLNNLIMEEILVYSDSDGTVSLGDEFSLALCAVNCYENGEIELGEYLFSLLVNTKNFEAFKTLLNFFVLGNDQSKIIKLLDGCFDNLKSVPSFNFNLYLLNYVYDLPEKYSKYVLELDIGDMHFECNNLEEEKLIKDVYHNNFQRANQRFSKMGKQGFCTNLIKSAGKKQLTFSDKLYKQIKKNRFNDVMFNLEEENSKALSMREAALLYLVKTYYDVSNSGKAPEVYSLDDKNYLEMIFNNNFQGAAFALMKAKGLKCNNDYLYVMLSKILVLIKKCEDNKENNNSFDLEEKLDNIKRYLKYIGKEEYIFLFEEYFKIAKYDSSIMLNFE